MDKFPEAFARFEKSEISTKQVRDSNDLIRQFRYWQNRGTTTKQDLALRHIAEEKGIRIIKGRGISEKEHKSREEIKKRFTVSKYYTKKGIVNRIVARDKKGRFTKK